MDILDGFFLLMAFYLYLKAKDEYKNIALVVFCWFFISDVMAHHFFLELRAANNWLIYLIYNFIIGGCWLFLCKFKSHLVIFLLLTTNVLLSIVASFYFIGNLVPKSVYNMYPYAANTIAGLVLIYLWMLGNGVRRLDSDDNNRGYIANLLRVRYGIYNRGSK